MSTCSSSTPPCLAPSADSRPTERCLKPRPRARSARSAYPTSAYFKQPLTRSESHANIYTATSSTSRRLRRKAGSCPPSTRLRCVGFMCISNFSRDAGLIMLSFVFFAMQLQPFCQQKPIVEYCKKHNIVVQAYCPVLRGDMGDPAIQEISMKVRVQRPLERRFY